MRTWLATTAWPHPRYVVGIPNFIQLAGKAALWVNMVRGLGLEGASRLMPESQALWPSKAYAQIGEWLDRHGRVVLKGDRQKREALCVLAHRYEIPLVDLSRYKLVQRVVWPLHQVFGRHYSLRFWLFLAVGQGQVTWSFYPRVRLLYAATNGFVSGNEYYSKDLPLFADQFTPEVLPPLWLRHALGKMDNILGALHSTLTLGCHQGSVYADLFGADVVIGEEGVPYVLEFNRNPSMEPLQAEDASVKEHVMGWFFEKLFGSGIKS